MRLAHRAASFTAPRIRSGVIDARQQNPARTLTDSSSVVWGITLMSQVTYNGTTDAGTSQVVKVALVTTNVWQLNAAGNWYFKAVTASPASGGWSGPTTTPLAAGYPERIADVLATFGFNTLAYWSDFNDSRYPALFVAAMNYCRNGSNAFLINREQSVPSGGTLNARTAALIAAGVRCCFIVPADGVISTGPVAGAINTTVTQAGLAGIWAFESTNEPAPKMTAAQAKALDAATATAVAGNGTVAGIVPVVSFSSIFTGSMAAVTTYAGTVGDETSIGVNQSNWHGYVNDGAFGSLGRNNMVQAYAALNGGADALNNRATLAPGRPWVLTEMGGEKVGTAGAVYGAATAAAGGKMRLNYYLGNYLRGCNGTFDWFFHPPEALGWFDNTPATLTPQQWATTFRNFCGIVSDGNGGTERTFSPTVIDYTVTGLPGDGHVLKTQGSDGKDRLILWNEPAVQSSSLVDLSPTATTVTVTANQALSSVLRYDPTVGTGVVQNYGAKTPGGTFTVPIAGYPQIVIITP